MCRVLKVNRSGYYKHFSSETAARTVENQKIRTAILEIHNKFNKRFGAAKIKVVLFRDYGINSSVGRVYRLLKGMNLPKMSTVKPVRIKSNTPDINFENKLKQQFNVPAPNLVWCSDITYIKTGSSFSYLCVIIDLFSRKVISYNVSNSMTSKPVIDTLHSAVKTRTPQNPVLFHSDQGVQYTSELTRKFCDEHDLVQSFSAKAHPYDNAVAESFFKHLKHEDLNRKSFNTIRDVKLAVFRYIDCFYNTLRPHSAILLYRGLFRRHSLGQAKNILNHEQPDKVFVRDLLGGALRPKYEPCYDSAIWVHFDSGAVSLQFHHTTFCGNLRQIINLALICTFAL